MAGGGARFDPTINYYQVLNVPYSATRAEITRAYRSLMRQAHPDRARGSSEQERKKAEERAKLLNAAYAVLSKPELRREYDRGLRQTAMSDALMQRYTGSAPGRPSPTAERRAPSSAMRRAQRRAGRSALLHLVIITVILVVVIVVLIVLVAVVPQGIHALAG